MLTVAIVCAAGASSTFLARRLSDIATAKGHSFRFVPAPIELVSNATADVVALTSHIASPSVEESLSARGIEHVVLPATVRGGFGAEDALATIVDYFGNNGQVSEAVVASAESKEN